MDVDKLPHRKGVPILQRKEDYINWKRKMLAYLEEDDEELIALDPEPSEDSEDHSEWLKKSKKAKRSIILSIGTSAMAKTGEIIDDRKRTAKELWDKLSALYTTTNAQAKINLKQKLESLRFDDKKDFNAHVNRFQEICDELAAYGERIEDSRLVQILLKSLPPSFDTMAQSAAFQDDLSFSRVEQAIRTEIERRRRPESSYSIARNSQDALVAAAAQTFQTIRGARYRGRPGWRGNRGRGYRGHFRGSRGHRGGYRGRGGYANPHRNYNDNQACFRCGQYGHFVRFCPHNSDIGGRARGINRPSWLRGGSRVRRGQSSSGNQSSGWGDDNSDPDAYHQQGGYSANRANHQGRNPFESQGFDNPSGNGGFSASAIRFRSTLATIDMNKSHKFLIDSGGTHNFVFDRSLFIEYEKIAKETVAAAFGTPSFIIGKGSVSIPIEGGRIIEAYHAPQFHSHILSVSQAATKMNLRSVFGLDYRGYNGNRGFLIDQTNDQIVYQTPCRDGLYSIDLVNKAASTSKISEASNTRQALEWHSKTGHPSADRYYKLSKENPSVQKFTMETLKAIECTPCSTGKQKKAPTRATTPSAAAPLEEVHLDTSGKFTPTLNGETYAVHFIDSFTAKSDLKLVKNRSEFLQSLRDYKEFAETHFAAHGHRIKKIRLDNAGEMTRSSETKRFCSSSGIQLEPSPPYSPESNGVAERLVQEHWTRARVLMFGTNLPNTLWGEALTFANWLRNRLPASRIGGETPITRWNPHVKTDFRNIPRFGQSGFAFIYRSKTASSKKLLPRSYPAQFVGMASDSRLSRVYIPATGQVKSIRLADFKASKGTKLPGISTLLDGLSRQASIEADDDRTDTNDNAEAHLTFCLSSIVKENPRFPTPERTAHEIQVPRNFKEACKSTEWAEAIDKEFNALVQRGTWTYVKRRQELHVIKHLWTFRLKLLDKHGYKYKCKARCVARGDEQEAGIDFQPESLYAPVATHEGIRLVLAHAASMNLILEGGDVPNAYLFGKLDIPVYMEQPCNSSGMQQQPGMICKLERSIYGLRQAGNIWGSLLHNALVEWGFETSAFDQRLYLFRHDDQFIIIAIVVDDMAFSSNSRTMLKQLYNKLHLEFNITLFGDLQSFLGWTITATPVGIKIDQGTYVRSLLKSYGMHNSNPAQTPLPSAKTSLMPIRDDEEPLSPKEHTMYRAIVGGLMYLAVSTRPDLAFSVSTLARQMHAPTDRHMRNAKRTLRYINGTADLGILYPQLGRFSPQSIVAAVDADWGGDADTRSSTTGFVVLVNGSPINWRTKRQTVIALSSGEAEYIAMSACARETSWMRKLFWEVAHQKRWSEQIAFDGTLMLVDSTAAIALGSSFVSSSRTKHISLKHHHVRELIANGTLQIEHVKSDEQPADPLTKDLSRSMLPRMAKQWNMIDKTSQNEHSLRPPSANF